MCLAKITPTPLNMHLGVLLFEMGDKTPAAPLLREAVEGLTAVYSADHSLVHHYQECLDDMGEDSESESESTSDSDAEEEPQEETMRARGEATPRVNGGRPSEHETNAGSEEMQGDCVYLPVLAPARWA